MKIKTPLPRRIRVKSIFSLLRRIILLAVIYVVIYYSVISRFGYEYFAIRIGVLPTVAVYIGLVAFPALLLGIPQRLCDRTYEGEVVSVKRMRNVRWSAGLMAGFRSWNYSSTLKDLCIDVVAHIRLEDGRVIKRKIRRYDVDDRISGLCQVGDTVRHYALVPFTQIYGRGHRHDIDCVWCGHYNPKEEDYCERCGVPLVHWSHETVAGTLDQVRNEPLREEEARVSVLNADTAPCKEGNFHNWMQYSQPTPIRTNTDGDFEIGEVTPTPEFGTYKRKVDFSDVYTHALMVMLLYLVTSWVSLTFRGSLLEGKDVWILYLIVSFVIPLGMTVFFLRDLPAGQWRASGRYPAWIRQGLLTVLPAELIRSAVAMIPISYNAFGGFFAPIAGQLWQMFYVIPNGRIKAINAGFYSPEDFLWFAVFTLLELTVRLIFVMLGYYLFWRKYEKEREAMLKHKKQPRKRVAVFSLIE